MFDVGAVRQLDAVDVQLPRVIAWTRVVAADGEGQTRFGKVRQGHQCLRVLVVRVLARSGNVLVRTGKTGYVLVRTGYVLVRTGYVLTLFVRLNEIRQSS